MIEIPPKAIQQLMNWWMGQKEHQRRETIRSDKDRENQNTRNEIDKVIKLLKDQLMERHYEDIDTYTENIDERTRKSDVITKIRLLEQILGRSVEKSKEYKDI